MAASVLPACLLDRRQSDERLDRRIGGGGALEERTCCGEVSCAGFDDAHRQTKLTYSGLEPTPVLRFRGKRDEWLGGCVDAPRGRDVIGFVFVLNGLQHEAERAADEALDRIAEGPHRQARLEPLRACRAARATFREPC